MAIFVCLPAGKKDSTLYPGRNNDIRPVYELQPMAVAGFTARYGVDDLVSFKSCHPVTVMAFEKSASRNDSVEIRSKSPEWVDLYHGISN